MVALTLVAIRAPYLCYPVMLVDVTQRLRTLGNVVRAIKRNVRTLI